MIGCYVIKEATKASNIFRAYKKDENEFNYSEKAYGNSLCIT